MAESFPLFNFLLSYRLSPLVTRLQSLWPSFSFSHRQAPSLSEFNKIFFSGTFILRLSPSLFYSFTGLSWYVREAIPDITAYISCHTLSLHLALFFHPTYHNSNEMFTISCLPHQAVNSMRKSSMGSYRHVKYCL